MVTAHAGNTSVSVKLDSARVVMGKTTTMHIEIVQDKEVNGLLLTLVGDTLNSKVEIADKGRADTAMLDNNRVQIKRDIALQAFDPGVYQLPPLLYVTGRDTIKSQPQESNGMKQFINTPVANIVNEIASYYGLKAEIRNSQAASIRLYFNWNRQCSAAQVVSQLNQFDNIRITLDGSSLVLE